VRCKQCEFPQSLTFSAEINIHFPGWEGLSKPSVWLLVCMNCGCAAFSIPEAELHRLAADNTNVRSTNAGHQHEGDVAA
jgi:hypothetical protein